jgi:sirohydrochlorin ferrochelatase
MAPATETHALIVSHGSPAHPAAQERDISALARGVSDHLPGWTVLGATLAADGALETALARLRNPLVYPFFMAPGWFTDTCLPRRIGDTAARRLPPLGLDPDLPALVQAEIGAALADHGLAARDTALVVAAHGSPRHPQSGRAVRRFADALAQRTAPRRLDLGFIEEPPFLQDIAPLPGPALCVPFFAISAGHVEQDIPAALDHAGFAGPVLPPVIRYRYIAAFIARALRRETLKRQAA